MFTTFNTIFTAVCQTVRRQNNIENFSKIFKDDILLCYCNSIIPKTIQSNTSTFTIKTILLLQKLVTCLSNQVIVKLLQKYTKEGKMNF